MQPYEIETIFNHLYLTHKEEWEQTRLLTYMTAQVNSKKKLELTDILQFPWEKKQHNTSISNEDIERLRNKSKEYGKRFSNETQGG